MDIGWRMVRNNRYSASCRKGGRNIEMDIGEYEECPPGVYARCDVCGAYAVDFYDGKRLCQKHLDERKGEHD